MGSDGRECLNDLLKVTRKECKDARNKPFAEHRTALCDAVRPFFPVLEDTYRKEGIAYANRSVGKSIPSLLQELLLGIPLLVDIHDGVSFGAHYGLTINEFAKEVQEGRIIPIINQKPETRAVSGSK